MMVKPPDSTRLNGKELALWTYEQLEQVQKQGLASRAYLLRDEVKVGCTSVHDVHTGESSRAHLP